MRALANRIDDDLAALRKAPQPRTEDQRKQIEETESCFKIAVREAKDAEAKTTCGERGESTAGGRRYRIRAAAFPDQCANGEADGEARRARR